MFCANCGKELKDGARFCSACGAPVASGVAGAEEAPVDTGSGSKPLEMAQSSAQEQATHDGFAGQMEQDRKRSRRKLSPLMIIAIVLALLAGTALAAVLIVQQANQSEEVPAQGRQVQQEQETSYPASSEPELTPEEAAIKALDGWWESQWHKPPYLPAFGHVHDGVIDWYHADADGTTGATSVAYSSTVNITRAERFDENGTQGWRFFTNTSSDDSWAYYQAAGELDELPIYMVSDGYGVITESHTDHPTRFGMRRIVDGFDWERSLGTRELFEQAQRLAAARDDSASSDAAAPAFDQTKAEADARAAAEAAGKTVLEGTVFVGKETDWAEKEGLPRAPNPDDAFTYVGLILDESATVSARNADGATYRERPYVERSGVYVLLGSDFQSNAVDLWRPYDGQRVSVAFSDFGAFSDSLGALFAFSGTGDRIAPLTEADIATSSSAGADSDFVLPESDERRYSRSELEKLDTHDLFLARNEIFARHGCGFKTPELRERFGSMSWYSEKIPAGSYDTEMLNDIEKDNVELIKSIEENRNSPYI